MNYLLQGQVITKRNASGGFKEFYFNLMGFNQYGLLHDDILHETDVVQEAISRLPPEMQVRFCFFFQ